MQLWRPSNACSGRSSSMIRLWCMDDGRIVDPTRVCPHSIHTLLKKAARAWQWRRVAHEDCEGLDRGADVAPLFAALYSPRLSTQEQSFLRSVVVDGQWTQRRRYRAAKTLSPLCALCGSEEGSLIHRHFRCSEVPKGEPSNMLGPFHAAAQPGAPWKHKSFAARALLPALKGRPPGHTVPYETRGDRSLFPAYEGQDADLCVAGWGLVANAGTGQPVAVSRTLPFLVRDVDGAELFGLFMFLRIAHAPAQYVMRGPPRPSHQLGQTCGATSGARSMPVEAWATPQGDGAHHSRSGAGWCTMAAKIITCSFFRSGIN